jgi:hypothetical protein
LARIETIVEAGRDLTGGKGSGHFLFVDHKTLGANNPLGVK